MNKLKDLCPLDPIDDLSLDGLIDDVDELRRASGLASEDPRAPGYLSRTHLTEILGRVTSELQNKIVQLYVQQCTEWHNLVEEADARLEAAEAAVDRQVEAFVNQFLAGEIPPIIKDYMDEIKILLAPSATGPKIDGTPKTHWGVIPEPYIPFVSQCVVEDVATEDRIEYAPDFRLFDTVRMSPWNVERYSVEGRYIYVANNGVDLTHCFVWVLDKNRVKDYARDISNVREDLDAKATRDAVYERFGYTASEIAADLIPQANDRMVAWTRGDLEAAEREWVFTRQTEPATG